MRARQLLTGVLLLLPLPAGGQSERDQALLTRIDAAIGIEPIPDMARPEDGVARQIQQGLLELERHLRQSDRRALERALFRFNQASLRRPEWAWPEYAMARAFLLLHDLEAPVIASAGSRLGEPHVAAMWRHLLEATRRDPDLLRARILLAELAYAAGDREPPPDVREALAVEVTRRDARPEAMVAWARHQRALGATPVALAILDRAAQLGADPSVLALERARTLAALDRIDDARASYWQGLDPLTRDGHALYRQDVAWLVDADSIAAFDAVARAEVGAWLRRFWAERDAAATRDEGARLGAHLNRWVSVLQEFRIPSPWRRTLHSRVDYAFDYIGDACVGSVTPFYERLPVRMPWLPGDVRADEPIIDHRGVIFLRHGAPLTKAVPPLVIAEGVGEGTGGEGIVSPRELSRLLESLEHTEVWVYWIEGGYRVFAFRGSDALGKHAATTLGSYLPWHAAQAWLALARVLPEYTGAAIQINRPKSSPATCYAAVRQAVAQQRTDAQVGITSDSDTPPVLDPWRAVHRFFAVGHGADGSGRAVVTFALQVGDLAADTLTRDLLAWPIEYRLVAYRPSDGRRITIDTVRGPTGRPAQPDQFLSGYFEVPLEPGAWQLSLRASQQRDSLPRAYALRRHLVVDDGPALALTDIVTGRSGQPGWTAPDGLFPINTLGTWPEGGTVELWYELRGIPPGEEYHTTIQVLPAEQRLRRDISVRVTDRSPGGIIRVRRTLGLENLDSGRYTLVVTVEHGDSTVRREQDILVTSDR